MSWLSDIQNGIDTFNTGVGTGVDWLVDRGSDVGAGFRNLFSGRDWMDDDEDTSKMRNEGYNATSGDTFATPVSIATDLGIGGLGAALAPFTAGASVPVAAGLLAAKTAGEQGKNIDAAISGKDEEGNELSWQDRLGKGAMAAGTTALAGLGGGALTKAGGKAATKTAAKQGEKFISQLDKDLTKKMVEKENAFQEFNKEPWRKVFDSENNTASWSYYDDLKEIPEATFDKANLFTNDLRVKNTIPNKIKSYLAQEYNQPGLSRLNKNINDAREIDAMSRKLEFSPSWAENRINKDREINQLLSDAIESFKTFDKNYTKKMNKNTTEDWDEILNISNNNWDDILNIPREEIFNQDYLKTKPTTVETLERLFGKETEYKPSYPEWWATHKNQEIKIPWYMNNKYDPLKVAIPGGALLGGIGALIAASESNKNNSNEEE